MQQHWPLVQVGILPERGDIVWTEWTTIVYPLWCSCAGIIAGMFGVGGGIVKGPLMLHLGVLPEVAAATSATMILFTSCAPPPPPPLFLLLLAVAPSGWSWFVSHLLVGCLVQSCWGYQVHVSGFVCQRACVE